MPKPRKSEEEKNASQTKNKTVAKSVKAKVEPKPKVNKTKVESKNVEKKEDNVVDDVVDDVVDVSDVEVISEPKKRFTPTKETILGGYDEIITNIEEEITKLRENSTKSKGVKFLRSLGKKVKTLRAHSARVMKKRNTVVRKNNNNSGFLKPVNISEDMAKFTGWNKDELRSRVDVTKYVCQYIKDNNLQNPEDRRQIKADPKLSKLLGYDAKRDDPLTYYRLQTHMKKHFLKPDVAPIPE
jgi:chromatin remodeling complex protein RSC6